MSSKRKSASSPTAEEIVRGGAAGRRRRSHPPCVTRVVGEGRRGVLDPHVGAGRLTLPAYTDYLTDMMRRVFVGGRRVVVEWRAMEGEMIRSLRTGRPIPYAPEIDLAVGPFAVLHSCEEEYDRMAELHAELLRALLRAFQANLRNHGSSFRSPRLGDLCSHNMNSRCFMALEIEKGNPAAKYLMGSMVNAVSLGRVGVVVAWDQHRLRGLLRTRETIMQWQRAGKNTLNPVNLLLVNRLQMARVVTRYAESLEAVVTSPPYRVRPDRALLRCGKSSRPR